MAERVLTLRELNRATLARQMLLVREPVPVLAAIERLVGLQSQALPAPYIGLWTRLNAFRRDDLTALIERHAVIKATMMRATLHLVTAEDYMLLRATLQPALTGALEAALKQRGTAGLDVETVVKVAHEYLAEQPHTFEEISTMLAEYRPDTDLGSMRYAVRMNLPMVQVPVTTGWGYPGNPKFTLAESWLGKPIPKEDNLRTLLLRYLAAFGPATVKDFEMWSGLSKLKSAIEKLKPELRLYQDERGRELLDRPDMPLPTDDTPAPERFLPEYDNLLRAHQDRTRVVADAHRSKVYLAALRVASTILIDGVVGGTWKIEKKKGTATLLIEPFEPLRKNSVKALTDEGERLVRFVEPQAKTFEVRFTE